VSTKKLLGHTIAFRGYFLSRIVDLRFFVGPRPLQRRARLPGSFFFLKWAFCGAMEPVCVEGGGVRP
jgi:hypothetical protein